MPTPQMYENALTGNDESLPDDRRILPERLMPGDEHYRGPLEPWGQSQFTNNAQGDLVLLKTIQKFNSQFGPQP